MITLEEMLEIGFADLSVSEDNQNSIKGYLNVLKTKDEATYGHSIRVGYLAMKIARHMHLDEKALFFSGTLHDMGKALIPPETLKKTEGFNADDKKIMEKHVDYTYMLLRGVHEFSAEIALRHHRYQADGYPKRLPKPKVGFSQNTKLMIDFYARILSLADFYDAITSRVNDKFGDKKKMAPEEAKAIMLKLNPDQRYVINDLYKSGIFGNQ